MFSAGSEAGVQVRDDAATGTAVREAPGEGQAVALDPASGALAVVGWDAGAENLALYDPDGTERWRASADFGSGDRATAVGNTLWLYSDAGMWGWTSYDLYAYDLASGAGAALPGAAASFTPGELVTTTGDYDAPVLSAWPSDLW